MSFKRRKSNRSGTVVGMWRGLLLDVNFSCEVKESHVLPPRAKTSSPTGAAILFSAIDLSEVVMVTT